MSDQKDPAAFDHESDPAHTPGAGWSDEGGASHLGPATHLDSKNPPVDSDDRDGQQVVEDS